MNGIHLIWMGLSNNRINVTISGTAHVAFRANNEILTYKRNLSWVLTFCRISLVRFARSSSSVGIRAASSSSSHPGVKDALGSLYKSAGSFWTSSGSAKYIFSFSRARSSSICNAMIDKYKRQNEYLRTKLEANRCSIQIFPTTKRITIILQLTLRTRKWQKIFPKVRMYHQLIGIKTNLFLVSDGLPLLVFLPLIFILINCEPCYALKTTGEHFCDLLLSSETRWSKNIWRMEECKLNEEYCPYLNGVDEYVIKTCQLCDWGNIYFHDICLIPK